MKAIVVIICLVAGINALEVTFGKYGSGGWLTIPHLTPDAYLTPFADPILGFRAKISEKVSLQEGNFTWTAHRFFFKDVPRPTNEHAIVECLNRDDYEKWLCTCDEFSKRPFSWRRDIFCFGFLQTWGVLAKGQNMEDMRKFTIVLEYVDISPFWVVFTIVILTVLKGFLIFFGLLLVVAGVCTIGGCNKKEDEKIKENEKIKEDEKNV